MLVDDRHAPREPADPITISYALIRHLGFMLDELSAEGLKIWQDEPQSWRWAWAGANLEAERGFWAIGEAIVDAVVARFTQVLEGVVRRAPEQYFWHHRRWRRQPPGTPPELREP